jgi:hypothetical protein
VYITNCCRYLGYKAYSCMEVSKKTQIIIINIKKARAKIAI